MMHGVVSDYAFRLVVVLPTRVQVPIEAQLRGGGRRGEGVTQLAVPS